MPARLVNKENEESTDLMGVTILGRKQGKGSFIFLPDQRVSRQHAMIRQQGESEFWFSDLGSFNGSFVNGQRATTSTKLKDGDVIRICDFQLRFDQDEVSNAPTYETTAIEMTQHYIRNENVIMLVSDLKGFTGLAEKLTPDQLAQVIGGWYKSCNLVMDELGATIDKFIGDAVFAYWLEPSSEKRENALKASKMLIEKCNELQQQHGEMLEPMGLCVEAGVGIHMGQVVLSPVSSGSQTILGDPVNVTFRLEGLTRQLGQQILISEEVLAFEGDIETGKPVFCGEFEVKGRTQPLRVHACI